MLLNFTDATTGQTVAVNPVHVICVFTNTDEKTGTKVTVINTLSGNVAVIDDYLETVGRINGSLSN